MVMETSGTRFRCHISFAHVAASPAPVRTLPIALPVAELRRSRMVGLPHQGRGPNVIAGHKYASIPCSLTEIRFGFMCGLFALRRKSSHLCCQEQPANLLAVVLVSVLSVPDRHKAASATIEQNRARLPRYRPSHAALRFSAGKPQHGLLQRKGGGGARTGQGQNMEPSPNRAEDK